MVPRLNSPFRQNRVVRSRHYRRLLGQINKRTATSPATCGVRMRGKRYETASSELLRRVGVVGVEFRCGGLGAETGRHPQIVQLGQPAERLDPRRAKPDRPADHGRVMFDQHVKQNSLGSIVADLATGWSWGEDGKELTFKLRSGVKWHDGKPFTAKDVVCTWD